jgi:predicted glycosyltransferase
MDSRPLALSENSHGARPQARSAATRVLIYSQDGLGLGHLRRSRNIARALVEQEPGCAVLILADSPATPFFASVPGVDYLKLPTILKATSTSWLPGSLPFPASEVVKLRAGLMLSVLEKFAPDVILVDHMPVGALGELKPVLDAAARWNGRPRLCLGLRDVLDAPAVTRRVWAEVGAYAYLRLYDDVLIYGSEHLYDGVTLYGLTPDARQVTYCNYVAGAEDGPQPPGESDEVMVLVTGGGGGDAFPLAKAFLDAFPLLARHVPLRAVILTGPNMPIAEREVLEAGAAGYPVEIRCEDSTPWLQQASAVVTMAGYNTLCEVMKWRKKALVVPRSGPSQEQRIRSRLFSEQGIIRTVDPDSLTPRRLTKELVRLLNDNQVPDLSRVPLLDGAERAASVILGGSVSADEGAPVAEMTGHHMGE